MGDFGWHVNSCELRTPSLFPIKEEEGLEREELVCVREAALMKLPLPASGWESRQRRWEAKGSVGLCVWESHREPPSQMKISQPSKLSTHFAPGHKHETRLHEEMTVLSVGGTPSPFSVTQMST